LIASVDDSEVDCVKKGGRLGTVIENGNPVKPRPPLSSVVAVLLPPWTGPPPGSL